MSHFFFKTKILLCLIFFLFAFAARGQNLVPNPGFEDYWSAVYLQTGDLDSCKHWRNPTGASPDYFNSALNDTFSMVDVPLNVVGYQQPKTGNAYVGIIPLAKWDPDTMVKEYREYLQAKLTSPLDSGVRYYISFYASPADSSFYAIKSLGAYFSSSAVGSSNWKTLPYIPQVVGQNFVQDKTTWTKVEGSFIAAGGEQYITIGNFSDFNSTDTLYIGYNVWCPLEWCWDLYSYYYIDDVCVSSTPGFCDDSLRLSIEQQPAKNMLSIYPNPANNEITIENSSESLELVIYNLQGSIIYALSRPEQSVKVNTSSWPAGMYFLYSTGKNNTIKKIIIQH